VLGESRGGGKNGHQQVLRKNKTKLEETDDELLPCMYLYDDEEREIMLSVASFHVSLKMEAFLADNRDNERGCKNQMWLLNYR
jgi:hypothetical protein